MRFFSAAMLCGLLLSLSQCSGVNGTRVNDGNCILGLQQFEPAFSYLVFTETMKENNNEFRNVTYDVSVSQRTLSALDAGFCDLGIVSEQWLAEYTENKSIMQTTKFLGYHCGTNTGLVLLTNRDAGEDVLLTANLLSSEPLTGKLNHYGIEKSREFCSPN